MSSNELINESSPYLLQHAHNPVDWKAWKPEVFEQAEREKKLLLVSIGYSSCHWCHVMEKECFRDEGVAKLMNSNYISVKIDREEHPEVDEQYMTALQLMTGQGGWPLNCIALPGGQAVWGGTYFPREQWMQILQAVYDFWKKEPARMEKYAAQLLQGIRRSQLIEAEAELAEKAKGEKLRQTLKSWSQLTGDKLDMEKGGFRGAPKFPVPAVQKFALDYALESGDKKLLGYSHSTLKNMCRGGIYDQLGGGFARYSTDQDWKVPHFEKMLYDNAQMLGLYSRAGCVTGEEEYQTVAAECLEFLQREMMDGCGLFYSAIDADSEGEEGAYYVWTERELRFALGTDYPLFAEYFGLPEKSLWENGKHILQRTANERDFARKKDMESGEFSGKLKVWKTELMELRKKRPAPATDKKMICSWNALLCSELAEAYMHSGDRAFLNTALAIAEAIEKYLVDNNTLYHSICDGNKVNRGLLEDHAHLARAYIQLARATGKAQWWEKASETMEVAETFYSPDPGFYRSSVPGKAGVLTTFYELTDSVIPSSNAVMATNLLFLGKVTGNKKHLDRSREMLEKAQGRMRDFPENHAGWYHLLLFHLCESELVVSSPKATGEMHNILRENPLSGIFFTALTEDSGHELFKERFGKEMRLFLCKNRSCEAPVGSNEELTDLLGR